MTGAVFVDTNVLVYVRDEAQGKKQRRAAEWMATLWDTRRGRLSVQVLQEYYTLATRKLKHPRPVVEVREDVLCFAAWKPVQIDLSLIERAWDLQDRFDLSWWDSLIAAAAVEARCSILLSEDFQEGQILDGLTIMNPFLHEPAELV